MKIFTFFIIAMIAIVIIAFDYSAYVSYTPTSLFGIADRVIICFFTDIMVASIGLLLYGLRD